MDLTHWQIPADAFYPLTMTWIRLEKGAPLFEWMRREAPEYAGQLLRLTKEPGDPVEGQKWREKRGRLGFYRWWPLAKTLEKVSKAEDGLEEDELLAVHLDACSSENFWPDLLREEVGKMLAARVAEMEPALLPDGSACLPLHIGLRPEPDGAQPVWTPSLSHLYEETQEENFLTKAPYLWLPGEEAPEVRWRYRRVVSQLFMENFLSPFRHLCEEKGWKLWVRWESGDPLASLLQGYGIIQPFFARVDLPGVDYDHREENRLFLLKQAAGFCEQFRGWSDPVGRKPERPVGPTFPIGESGLSPNTLAQFAYQAEEAQNIGAGNLTVPEGDFPLRGDGKRRHGPDLFHRQNIWWPEWEKLGGEIARRGDLLAQGERRTPVLIILPCQTFEGLQSWPLEGEWELQETSPVETASEYARHLSNLIQALQAFQIEYEITCEDVFKRNARTQANAVWLGDKEYNVLILPPAWSWQMETLKVLRRYARMGGTVLLPQPLAKRVDGKVDGKLERLLDAFPNIFLLERAGRDVCYQLNRLEPPLLAFKTPQGVSSDSIWLHSRQTADRLLTFFVNRNATQPVEGRFYVQPKGAVRVMDVEKPCISVRKTDEDKGLRAFDYDFPAQGEGFLAIGGESDLTEPWYQRMPHATSAEALEPQWKFERLHPNLMLLEFCRWGQEEDQLARISPLPLVRAEIFTQERKPDKPLILDFEFDSELVWEGKELDALVEPNPDLEVRLNGRLLEPREGENPLGEDFAAYPVADFIQAGANRLELRCQWQKKTVVESPVLAGDFAVYFQDNGRPILREEPARMTLGSWTDQGYPYYHGVMRYRQNFLYIPEDRNRYFLRLQKPQGSFTRIQVDGHESQPLYRPPHRLEITRLLEEGEHELKVEIGGTLYNLFGPTHLHQKLLQRPMALENWDKLPFQDRRLWNYRPRFHDFGLLEGAFLECYDPSAPPPKKTKEENETEE